MLKNFFGIKLNSLSEKILSFWEKDFDASLSDNIDYLNKNLENQEEYNSIFSKLLQEMSIFESEDQNKEDKDKKDNNEQESKDENGDQNQSDSEEEKSRQDESLSGTESSGVFDEYKIDEHLVDTDSEKKKFRKYNSKNK